MSTRRLIRIRIRLYSLGILAFVHTTASLSESDMEIGDTLAYTGVLGLRISGYTHPAGLVQAFYRRIRKDLINSLFVANFRSCSFHT
jgi:hypothetical protein